ncbi:hypothetical protein D5086_008366 [Populus alba]|uniref:Uncharacterized protein n=1 Tax=Populus alba TaxID=43335 RepID=A0ACC4CF35_POPAL
MGSGPSGAAMKLVAAVMTFLSVVVFLGYMMIWSMKPTNTFYLHWWPDVLKKTSSTYLGEQGTNTLIYAFPILFIATIGSLYLHLEKKYDHDHSTRFFISRIVLLKRPVITKGLLGIVSWTELTFLAMFVALLVWSMYSYTHNMFAFAALEAAQEKFQVWEVKLQSAALSLGLAGNTCLAFLFFPVTRGSSILQFVGLTSEASIKYHIWLGNVTMVIFTAHGLSYITYWSLTHQISQILKWDKFVVANVAGEIALLAGLVMWTTSLGRIRRKLFEIFYYRYNGITVTSNSNMDSDKLNIVIKREGGWSHKLYQILSSPSPTNRLEVAMEGPYGPPSTDFTRYERLVLVSGGSGITPFISIIREIIFKSNTTSSKTPRIHLICAFKKYVDLTMLDLLLPVSGTTPDLSRLQLQIEAYITRETESKTENQSSIRTILFRPNPSDRPVSAVLGPNSWLWLGAIISSSFIIFLILIGLLTRFYIYPIDDNTNMKYPVPASSAFNMLFVCIAITIAASAAFLWNKRENAKETSQIRTTDVSTPAPSPTSLVYETELESLPRQSLRQATTLHLGQRPNLKKILSEYKEEKQAYASYLMLITNLKNGRVRKTQGGAYAEFQGQVVFI